MSMTVTLTITTMKLATNSDDDAGVGNLDGVCVDVDNADDNRNAHDNDTFLMPLQVKTHWRVLRHR